MNQYDFNVATANSEVKSQSPTVNAIELKILTKNKCILKSLGVKRTKKKTEHESLISTKISIKIIREGVA